MAKSKKPMQATGDYQPEPTDQTRREALAVAALGAGGAMALSQTAFAGQLASLPSPRMHLMNCEQWSAMLGQKFDVKDADGSTIAWLVLEEVFDDQSAERKSAPRPAHIRQQAVSLVFACSRPIEDADYLVCHSELGFAPCHLFETRRGDRAEKTRYQVVLN